jgi:hypothetical protein
VYDQDEEQPAIRQEFPDAKIRNLLIGSARLGDFAKRASTCRVNTSRRMRPEWTRDAHREARRRSSAKVLEMKRNTGEALGLLQIRVPYLGVDIWVCRRLVWWRRISRAARTSAGLAMAIAAWERALGGSELRRRLSEPVSMGRVRDPRKLEAVLSRALLLDVLGRRARVRARRR